MNIEIANRLVELRKKYGYSQEELANKLGLSRQAVSKWERAESSPDTDNLICLAKLYNCSLDDLLKTDDSIEDIIDNNVNKDSEESKSKKIVNIKSNGIYVKDGDEEVELGFNGIHVKKNGKECHIGSKFHDFDDTLTTERYNKIKQRKRTAEIISSVSTLLIIIAYLCVGFIWNVWHPTWIMFLLIPLIESLTMAIAKRNAAIFVYPILATIIYLIIGFYFDFWHPGWVVFLTIPVYYAILPKKKNCVIYKDIDGKVYKDYGKKDEDFVVSFNDDED